MGGMGVRDLKCFNQTLLAKKGWRLSTNTSTIIHNVLKVRYFKNSSFLEARRGYNPSFSWRSIWGAKSLLLDGMKWRVGNGLSIKVWEDSWMPGEGSHLVPTPMEDSDVNMRVSELIDFNEGCWNVEAVAATFNEVEGQAIKDIPLSRPWPDDKLYWWPTPDGIYIVRYGYWLSRMGHLRTWELFNGASENELWRLVWRMGVPPMLSVYGEFSYNGCYVPTTHSPY